MASVALIDRLIGRMEGIVKRSYGRFLWCAAVVTAMSSLTPKAFAQGGTVLEPVPVGVNFQRTISHNSGIDPASNPAAMGAAIDGAAIPLTNYTDMASDGNTYSGVLVGTSPFDGSGATTTVTSPIIPVVIQANLGGVPYTSDPTAPDLCLPSGSDVDLVTNSPIFGSTDYMMNGVDVGNTQYVDAHQRASFWSTVNGTDYHLLLQPTVTGSQSFNTFTQGYYVPPASCGAYNLFFEITEFDSWVTQVALPAAGVDPTQFPILLLQNVSLYIGNINNCCVLGYHNALDSFQTYSPSNVDTSGFFGGADIDTLSHEVGEWANDPLGNNATPSWGNIGQVTGCQANLEVGDPLSGTQFPAVTMNGVDYHPQELAHFSWFFGDNPSLAAGGVYSNNGTFTTPALPCTPASQTARPTP
jgi:hypothetical protein